MRRIYLLFACAIVYMHSNAFVHIVSYSLYQTVTKEEFRATAHKRHLPKAVVPANYDVDVYDITYYTQWHDGSTIKATGLYYVPRNVKKPLAELVYDHGTRVGKGRSSKLGGEENICVGFAMDGYAVMEPDYIGLGNGEKFHLYQIAGSEGQASVDMIFAARELNDSLHLKTSGQLFITGYSQGGHASLATHKLIQEKYADRLHVTASSPMSGAYDMSGAQAQVMYHTYSRPHYLPYFLMACNEVYHLVPGDLNQIYKHPYDSLVPLLFDGKHSISAIDKALPSIPRDMIRDDVMKSMFTDTPNVLTAALRDNSLCDWKPDAPVQLCYCDSDEQVTPKNTFVAYNTMKNLGAKHVTIRDAGKNFTHTRCALVAILYTKMYFDTFRHGSKYGGKGAIGQRIVANIAKKFLQKQKFNHHGEGNHHSDNKG